MITITINIENGNEAADACREVARLIENGYTSGMIGCFGDTFDIEGDIFSDDEDVVISTESGKTEVRITAVKNHHYPFTFYGDAVIASHFRLTEVFGEDNENVNGDKSWALLFDVRGKNGAAEEFGVNLYNIQYGAIQEDDNIYWYIGSNKTFNSSTAREVIDMLISGQLENDEYKIIEVKKK